MNSYYHMNTRVWARTDDISTRGVSVPVDGRNCR